MTPARRIVPSPRQLLYLTCTALLFLLLMAARPQNSLASPPTTLSGAYTGAANISGLAQFGTWRGAPATVALDYLGNTGWNDIEYPSWTLDAWQPFQVSGGQLVLSVPMLVDSPAGTFADGAAGDYDNYYETLGQQLVADGYANAVLRMGWEFNGTWFPWSLSATDPAMSATEFIAYWRHLVDLFRAIPGSNFTFDWTVNPGPSDVPAADAYPGDAYVDYVGVDVYDSSWDADGNPITNDADRWNQIANQTYGLNWWLAFAQSHNKPITIPEWGLNTDTSSPSNGAGDDPSFIRAMYNWMQTNHPAYESYFDYGGSALDATDDPNASAQYQALWGDPSSGSSSTSGSLSSGSSSSSSSSTSSATGSSSNSPGSDSPSGSTGTATTAIPSPTPSTGTTATPSPAPPTSSEATTASPSPPPPTGSDGTTTKKTGTTATKPEKKKSKSSANARLVRRKALAAKAKAVAKAKRARKLLEQARGAKEKRAKER